jgi:hypothetical protein
MRQNKKVSRNTINYHHTNTELPKISSNYSMQTRLYDSFTLHLHPSEMLNPTVHPANLQNIEVFYK